MHEEQKRKNKEKMAMIEIEMEDDKREYRKRSGMKKKHEQI